MSEPDEDPPVTGGRDLPESLVWRPSEPLEDVTDRLKFHQGQLRPHWLKMDVFRLFAELAAQAEEIRRLAVLADELEAQRDAYRLERDIAQTDALNQQGEIRRLREALGHYANEDNWGNEMGSPILWQGPSGDGMVGKGGHMLAAKALEPQTTKPKD
jgi:hypothetical protein